MGTEKGKGTNVSDILGEDDLDEEPGEVFESAPPLEVGEERELGSSGIKKKLLKNVHYAGSLLDGTEFCSTRDNDEPLTFKLGEAKVNYQVALVDGTIVAKRPKEGIEFYVKDGHLCSALTKAIITMKKGEKVKLIVQLKYAFGEKGRDAIAFYGFRAVPPNSVLNIELELVSFKSVIDVTVSYTARLEDIIFEKKGVGGQPLEFVTDEEIEG
ncbi:hypothetical protein CRYUN_Cryun35bG0040400 [Craigia yunnanensis]